MSDWTNNRRRFSPNVYAVVTQQRDGTWTARLHRTSRRYLWTETGNPSELAAKSSATREAKRLGLVESGELAQASVGDGAA